MTSLTRARPHHGRPVRGGRVIFMLMGYAIYGVYEKLWQMTMGLTAGFFLMGSFLCCGIYDLSKQHSRGDVLSS